ncbi:YggT family protein [Leptolyngbya sp. NIES-2104]|uniref:YggT family protein n=1 Tax=Leptolyngbya sp. NIES-2104 TaxID=1552121 RepID=UPI0006EC54F3|nr:YggT family protein [Leptolyngbya sp. NIES-2104]GAP93680.1 cell division protein YlmG/Ycf19 (putative), YggT family [Leptolyngbya sp. NIES-2104]
MNPAILLITTVQQFLGIYFALLIIRILLSWFPSIDWYKQPFAILSQLTDPYLNLFRRVIPPLGGIDFSAILAIFVLQFAMQLIPSLLAQVLASVPVFVS